MAQDSRFGSFLGGDATFVLNYRTISSEPMQFVVDMDSAPEFGSIQHARAFEEQLEKIHFSDCYCFRVASDKFVLQ